MIKISKILVIGITLLELTGCETLPKPTATTVEGCGIAQWRAYYVMKSVASMTWTGGCSSGLAQGNGTLIVKQNDGKQMRYDGVMDKGYITGKGVYVDTSGWKFDGDFLWLNFTSGKIYNNKGQIRFSGIMAHNEKYKGLSVTYDDQRYFRGDVYFADGSSIEDGQYALTSGPAVGTASINPKTGAGIVYGKYSKDGKVIARFVEGKKYGNDSTYMMAVNGYLGNVLAGLEAENAKYQKEQAKQDAQDRRETYAMLGNATIAAAGGKNAEERRQLALDSMASTSGSHGASGNSTTNSTKSGSDNTTYVVNAGACNFQGYDQAIKQWTDTNPQKSTWGSRDTYQYAYFFGTEGLKILQVYKKCMSNADFTANQQALAGARDKGLQGCRQLSSDGGSGCVPKYPQ